LTDWQRKTGIAWSEWVATELTGKPVGIGAASWLRVRCLIQTEAVKTP